MAAPMSQRMKLVRDSKSSVAIDDDIARNRAIAENGFAVRAGGDSAGGRSPSPAWAYGVDRLLVPEKRVRITSGTGTSVASCGGIQGDGAVYRKDVGI